MTGCSCCVWVDIDDGTVCFANRTVVARKEHICRECRDKILPKEEYWLYEGMYEDEFFRNRMCKVCEEICETFFCNGHIFGTMYEFLEEHICNVKGEISSECINSLSEKAKARILDMIDAYIYEEDLKRR